MQSLTQKLRYGFLLGILIVSVNCGAQNGAPAVSGGRGIGMNTSGVNFRDVHAAFGNPAGLTAVESWAGALLAENRFLVSDIRSLALAAAYSLEGAGSFGLRLQYYGFDAYNEQQFSLLYARPLMEGLSIGAGFGIFNTRIAEYGGKLLPVVEVGLQAELLPGVQMGVRIHNPIRMEVVEDENMPTVFTAGLAYAPSDQLLMNLEVEKDIDFPARVRAGLEYALIDPLQLRLGVATEPTTLSFGLGLRVRQGLRLDFASSYHQWLGFSPGLGVVYVPDR